MTARPPLPGEPGSDGAEPVPRPADAGRSTDQAEPDPAPVARTTGGWLSPDRSTTLGVLIVVVLCVVSAAAAFLYNRLQPDAVITVPASPGSAAAFPMTLPPVLGDYARDASDAQPSSAADGSTTVMGRYSLNGQSAVVVLINRPATDPAAFLTGNGFDAVVSDLNDGACGTSVDTNDNACVVIRQGTAILTMGLLDQTRVDLLKLDRQIALQLSGA